MYRGPTLFSSSHDRAFTAMNSGPWSLRMRAGTLHAANRFRSVFTASVPVNVRATGQARHWRVYSSTTVRFFNDLPSVVWTAHAYRKRRGVGECG